MPWARIFHPLYPTVFEEIFTDLKEVKAVTFLLTTSIHLCFSFFADVVGTEKSNFVFGFR